MGRPQSYTKSRLVVVRFRKVLCRQQPVILRKPLDTTTGSTSLLHSHVKMELSFDDSRLRSDSKETDYHKEKNQSDSPITNPQPEGQISNGELSEKDQDVKCIVLSDPGLVICTVEQLQGSASVVSPEVESRKALLPPPLSPKRSPACKKRNKPSNSLARQTSPVLDGVKGNSQCRGLVSLEVPDMHNCFASGTLPKAEPKHPPQPPLRPLTKSPIKPPRPNKVKRAETEEGEERVRGEAEWSKHKEGMGEQRNKQEQDLPERKQKTEENEQTSGKESHLEVGKTPREILVVFTDIGSEEDVSSLGLTMATVTGNSSLLALGRSDLTQDVEPDMAATIRNCTSAVLPKPESMIPSQPPPKPPQKHPPKPPIKPPHLFSAMKSAVEEEKERRKQEEDEWRDLVEEERDEIGGEGKDRGKANRDSRDIELSTTAVAEIPSQIGQTVSGSIPKFCLMPPCRDRPTSVVTAENQTLDRQSQHPGNHQNKANGQVQPGPQEDPARVNPIGTDSNMETLKWTENSTEIQILVPWVRDSDVISKLSSGWEGTEVEGSHLDTSQLGLRRSEEAQEVAETLMDGGPKQTTQKTNARGKVKNLAKKVIGKLKEGREERRRTKAIEMELDEVKVEDIELIQDERRPEDEGPDEDAVEHFALTEIQSYADLMERMIKRRHATSDGPFASFKVGSPVKLMEELLTGDEWSQFLNRDQSSTPDPPDTAEPSVDSQFTPDVFEGNPFVLLEESVYENIPCLDMVTEESQIYEELELFRAPSTRLQSETNPMSPRTKDIYDTVKFIPPVQPAVTYMNFSDIKSQGVLDSSVQKYLIKLSKKRKRRAGRKQRGDKSNDIIRVSPSSTSPQQIFPASKFYCVPPSGGEVEQQLSAAKFGGSSPRCMAKIKTALKDKTILRAAQPKDDRGK